MHQCGLPRSDPSRVFWPYAAPMIWGHTGHDYNDGFPSPDRGRGETSSSSMLMHSVEGRVGFSDSNQQELKRAKSREAMVALLWRVGSLEMRGINYPRSPIVCH